MSKFQELLILGIILILASLTAIAQDADPPVPADAGPPSTAAPRLSEILAKNLESLPQNEQISRERREQAYAKLLEGQRYLWNMRRMRSSSPGMTLGARMAEQALRRAVEFDPKLAEGYTALAELSLTTPPQDIEEAISLAEIATRLDSDNFGGHRFLGRLYTIKSNLGRGKVNPEFAVSAIAAWKEIGRLDPRNAEAWAFLSAFYKESSQVDERIEALKKWQSSAAPLEQGFYGRVMSSDGELAPESASLKLGEALLETGQNEEALEILTRAISEDPENLEAVDLLGQALEEADVSSVSPVIEALRQAVFANPDNLSLNQILAQTLAGNGQLADAAKVLETAIAVSAEKDERTVSGFLVALGDLYGEFGKTDLAVEAYQRAMRSRSISKSRIVDDGDRDFAYFVIGKLLTTEKNAERYQNAERLIKSSRGLFSPDDHTLDRELISLKREMGADQEALTLTRALRKGSAVDYSLLRTEASILTDLGNVEEAVAIVSELIDKKPEGQTPSVMYDDFVNYLFISSLYNQSKRADKAILAATSAYAAAYGEERRQIAKLSLASAQQSSGDFRSAEKNLREILDRSPNNPIALNNLGYLFLETGKNFEQALDLIQSAVKVDGKNPSYLDSLGWAHFKLGKLEKAETFLRRALKYDPTSATILEHLGDVLKARGNLEGADAVWRKALRFANHSEDSLRISAKLAS